MDLVSFENAAECYERTKDFLLRDEAVNNLMISILIRLADGTGKWGEEPPWLYAVQEDGEIVACVVRTPPYMLLLTEAAPEVVDFIAESLHAIGASIPGTLGPKATVARYIARWSALTGLQARLHMSQRIYQLDQVIPVTGVEGHWELATEVDIDLLIPWETSFAEDVHALAGDIEQQVRNQVSQQRIQLWKNPLPVSMAAWNGPTPGGMRIGPVYTPPEHRNHGYASANVAKLSQRMLDSGRRFCFLYTDLANPVSNSIYQQIGYRPVCDVDEYRFDVENAHAR